MAESARIHLVKVQLGLEPEYDFLELPEQYIEEKDIQYASVPAEFWELAPPTIIPPKKERWQDKITWSNLKKMSALLPVILAVAIYSWFIQMYLDR